MRITKCYFDLRLIHNKNDYNLDKISGKLIFRARGIYFELKSPKHVWFCGWKSNLYLWNLWVSSKCMLMWWVVLRILWRYRTRNNIKYVNIELNHFPWFTWQYSSSWEYATRWGILFCFSSAISWKPLRSQSTFFYWEKFSFPQLIRTKESIGD